MTLGPIRPSASVSDPWGLVSGGGPPQLGWHLLQLGRSAKRWSPLFEFWSRTVPPLNWTTIGQLGRNPPNQKACFCSCPALCCSRLKLFESYSPLFFLYGPAPTYPELAFPFSSPESKEFGFHAGGAPGRGPGAAAGLRRRLGFPFGQGGVVFLFVLFLPGAGRNMGYGALKMVGFLLLSKEPLILSMDGFFLCFGMTSLSFSYSPTDVAIEPEKSLPWCGWPFSWCQRLKPGNSSPAGPSSQQELPSPWFQPCSLSAFSQIPQLCLQDDYDA